MRPFPLEILSPERAFYRGECLSLTVPLQDGLIGIQAHHAPLTAAIPEGELAFTRPDGARILCAVTNGILDVSADGRVRLLCESALLPEEIDEEKERRAAEEALASLRRKEGEREYLLAKLTFARAVNNLRVKRHSEQRDEQ